MTAPHRSRRRLLALRLALPTRILAVAGAIGCVMVASAASRASAASITNFFLASGPTQSADLDDYSAIRYRFAQLGRFNAPGNAGSAHFGTATNIVTIFNGPETLTVDLTGDVVAQFDVEGATGPYSVLVRVVLDGELVTTNDGFVEGNNGQAFASMSNISVTDLAGLNLVIASATSRGPTTSSGATPVQVVREFTVSGTPAQNHHEVRFRWTTRCQSIVAGLIGNGVMCEAMLGRKVGLVGGQVRLTSGPGSLSIAAGLVGTPTPSATASPTPTATPVLPAVSVHNASVIEGNRGTGSMLFTIDADRPHAVPITVRLATVNGSATAGADYTARNITVTLPAGVNQVTASIPVLGDALQEGNETFSVNIGNPTNATIGLGQATGTIVDDDSPVGIAELVAGNGAVAAGETVLLTLRWDHPTRWRDLDTVDLRLIDDTGASFWGRFTEGEDHFSLCDAASCSGSFAPGVGDPVDTGASTFHPASSVVRGSGASGPSVDLTFAVSLADSTRGRRFRIEAAASGDNGDEQPFATVGTLSVDSGSAGADGDGCQVGNRGGAATGVWMLLVAGLVLAERAASRARRRITDDVPAPSSARCSSRDITETKGVTVNNRIKRRFVGITIAAMAALSACGGGGGDIGPPLSGETKAAFYTLPLDVRTQILAERPERISYLGSVDGTNLYVGVITTGDSIEVYLCDGVGTAVWFKGAATGSDLIAANDEVSLTATPSGSGLAGSVTIDGATHDFVAVPADYPADIWQTFALTADDQLVRGGWIVLPDESQRGAIKQGAEILSTQPLDLATAVVPPVDGSNADATPIVFSAPATPSEPVPFTSGKKKVKGTLTAGQRCFNLQLTFSNMLDIIAGSQDPVTIANAIDQGNAALAAGAAMGCGWASDPSGLGQPII